MGITESIEQGSVGGFLQVFETVDGVVIVEACRLNRTFKYQLLRPHHPVVMTLPWRDVSSIEFITP